MDDQARYPPAPWFLVGQASVHVQTIPTERARVLVPQDLPLLQAWPGVTLGGIYWASYTAGSTLQYDELIIIPGLVRHRHRIGAWISHLYVNNPASVMGGREIWSLPKEQADFEKTPESMTVSQNGQALCKLPLNHARGRLPVPLWLPVISKAQGRAVWFRGSGKTLLGSERGAVEVPAGSPFESLGLGNGHRFHLDRLNLAMYKPA